MLASWSEQQLLFTNPACPTGVFCMVNSRIVWLFCIFKFCIFHVFKKTVQNNICVSIVLKAKSIKNKKKNWLTPQKGHFWVWVIKTEKKLFFFIFFFCFRRTNVILISIFENSQNNRYYIKWRFLWSITFVLRFKKLPIKRTFVRPLF